MRGLLNNKNFFKNSLFFDIAAAVATIVFIVAGLLVSLHRYWQYEVFYYNFGVFDQAIWRISRFQPPIIEHLLVGGRISLADHFDLSILLLAPVFWLTDKSEALLVVQALFAGLAGFVIYKIGIEILKDKFQAFGISLCYFFFVGIQNAVITDFHELTIMSFPITLVFLAIVKKRIKLFWLFFLLTLGFKEVTFLLGIGIAIFIYFYNKQWKKHTIAATIISILWGYLTINILIPYFSDGVYLHRPDLPDSVMGKVMAMFDHPSKRETVFYSLLNFGFLPVFAPSMWFVILQDYILRFIPLHVLTRWTLGLHYNAQVAPLLAIGTIFGFRFLQKFIFFKKYSHILVVLLILNSFIQFRFIHHGPYLMAINPALYNHTANFKYLDQLINKIPKNASIMTQNNLGVRFTHQKFIYLRENYEQFSPDYILLDNRPGQNPNNFLFAPEITGLIIKIQRDKNYVTMYHEGDQYIFQKKQLAK
jgi:uncharacterized membrane protein